MPVTVPAAVRTMAIFELFAREKREMTNKEIAQMLEFPESSTSDLLHTLHQQGYLMRTARSRRFFPTNRLNALIHPDSRNDRLKSLGKEAVEVLSSKTLETCFFGRLRNGAVDLLAVKEGVHALRYVLTEGQRFSLHGTALGKAILSMLPPDHVGRMLRAKPLRHLASQTQTDPAALEREVASYRETHIASAQSEGVDGVSAYAIGAKVGDEVIGLSCAGPSERMKANSARYADALREVAATLSTAGE